MGGPAAADRTEPVLGDVLEGGAGRDAPVRVADRRVVDEAAAVADPQGHFLGRGHGRILEERYFVPKSTATGSRSALSSISKYSRLVKLPWSATIEPGNCSMSVL